MTTEEDFQRQLDLHPDDWQMRLVFADWLDEQGDPRGAGYRVLGVLRRVPQDTSEKYQFWVFMWDSAFGNQISWEDLCVLPQDWFHLMKQEEKESRRRGEDKAAIAFAELSEQRRNDLLRVEVVV